MSDVLTHDAFLGGKVMAWQPAKGFRSGVDAVLMAAAVPAQTGQTVLELGCGVGVASLCLGKRVGGLTLTGIEVQKNYAALANRNAGENDIALAAFEADLRTLPDALRQVQYHHVIANPPYFQRTTRTPAHDVGRDEALSGDTPLADWIDVAAKRLAPKGYLTLIQHMIRLPEVLSLVRDRLGSIVLRPIQPWPGRAPELFLLQARHSGKAAFIMSAPLIMHAGDGHNGDRENYTPEVRDILRTGAQLRIAA